MEIFLFAISNRLRAGQMISIILAIFAISFIPAWLALLVGLSFWGAYSVAAAVIMAFFLGMLAHALYWTE